LLDEMSGTLGVCDGELVIQDSSPAFDFSGCQYSYVEILFPVNYIVSEDSEPISITGRINAGYFGGSFINMGDLDISVDLGMIDLEEIKASSVEASTEVGAIFAEEIFSDKSAKFYVHTGSINTHKIKSPMFTSKTKYGTTWNTDIKADKANVHAKYGYSTLLRPTHFTANTNQEIEVYSFYGKSLASYDQCYNLLFGVEVTEKGHIDVSYDDECEVVDSKGNPIFQHLGLCEYDLMEPTTTMYVHTTFGKANFVQNEPDVDELQKKTDGDFFEYDVYQKVKK